MILLNGSNFRVILFALRTQTNLIVHIHSVFCVEKQCEVIKRNRVITKSWLRHLKFNLKAEKLLTHKKAVKHLWIEKQGALQYFHIEKKRFCRRNCEPADFKGAKNSTLGLSHEDQNLYQSLEQYSALIFVPKVTDWTPLVDCRDENQFSSSSSRLFCCCSL